MTRRDLLLAALAAPSPGFQLVDVTANAGINFRHNSGAFGAKFLPETMGPGCAFLDYDNDGWTDILLVDGQSWKGGGNPHSSLRLYRNNRNGTFREVTREAGLQVELHGMGVAVGDFDNDGYPDLYVTAVGQNRLFRNNRRGGFVDVTTSSGLGDRAAFSTSALWFDFDRDGLLDLFVCNYVRWSRETDVFCSTDGKNKSYCTPEAYRGSTCWLFRNLGNGRFEDVTAKSGIFDASSKSLGAALLDVDQDGWLDLFVANDTQPNKLYRNNRDGTFRESAVAMGVAFSEDGRARAGMGVDTGDFSGTGVPGIAVTNFESEMMGMYEWNGHSFIDRAVDSGVGSPSRGSLGFGCLFLDINLDGNLDLLAVNGHIDNSVRTAGYKGAYAQAPHLFLNNGKRTFHDVAASSGSEFAAPKIARSAAYGDFDRDGDFDLLITSNGGPAYLYRNDVGSGNRSIRFYLEGRKSNRDAIGAMVRLSLPSGNQMAMVKSGSSYLSSSSKALTFGTGSYTSVDRVTVTWPSGRADEFKNLASDKSYRLIEGEKPSPLAYR